MSGQQKNGVATFVLGVVMGVGGACLFTHLGAQEMVRPQPNQAPTRAADEHPPATWFARIDAGPSV